VALFFIHKPWNRPAPENLVLLMEFYALGNRQCDRFRNPPPTSVMCSAISRSSVSSFFAALRLPARTHLARIEPAPCFEGLLHDNDRPEDATAIVCPRPNSEASSPPHTKSTSEVAHRLGVRVRPLDCVRATKSQTIHHVQSPTRSGSLLWATTDGRWAQIPRRVEHHPDQSED